MSQAKPSKGKGRIENSSSSVNLSSVITVTILVGAVAVSVSVRCLFECVTRVCFFTKDQQRGLRDSPVGPERCCSCSCRNLGPVRWRSRPHWFCFRFGIRCFGFGFRLPRSPCFPRWLLPDKSPVPCSRDSSPVAPSATEGCTRCERRDRSGEAAVLFRPPGSLRCRSSRKCSWWW